MKTYDTELKKEIIVGRFNPNYFILSSELKEGCMSNSVTKKTLSDIFTKVVTHTRFFL